MTLETMCRTCLISDFEVVPLLEVNFTSRKNPMSALQLLNSFTSIKITESDTCPQNICVNCLRHLKCLYDFKIKCERSAQILHWFVEQKRLSLVDEPPVNKLLVGQYTDNDLMGEYSGQSQTLPGLPIVRFDSILKIARSAQMASNNCQLYTQRIMVVPIDEIVNRNKEYPEKLSTPPSNEHDYAFNSVRKEPVPAGHFIQVSGLALSPSETKRSCSQSAHTMFYKIKEVVDKHVHRCEFQDNFLDDLVEKNRKVPEVLDNFDARPHLKLSLDPHAENFEIMIKSDGSVIQKRKIGADDAEMQILSNNSNKNTFSDVNVFDGDNKNGDAKVANITEASSDDEDDPTKKISNGLICPACRSSFMKIRELVDHLAREHTKNSECFICGSNEIRSMQYHCGKHLPKRFFCVHCNKGFASYSTRRKHYKSTKGAIHECRKCEQKFCLQDDYVWHMRRHEVEESVTQQIILCCGEEILSVKEFRQHRIKYHKDRVLFSCDLCPANFLTYPEYKKHEGEHKRAGRDPSCLSMRRCDICFYVCNTISALPLHVRSHSEIRKYGCDLCNRKFRSKPNMLRHRQAFHCNLRMYKCELCKKAYKYFSNLSLHRKSKLHQRNAVKSGDPADIDKTLEIFLVPKR